MSDKKTPPDGNALNRVAYGQGGYFTAEQGRECGFSPQLLAHHVRSGRYERIRRGLYRLRDFPSSPHDEVKEKWMVVGVDRAVVSHESALELHGLSDVLPNAVHLLVERHDRGVKPPAGVTLHTTGALDPSEVVSREGIRVTDPVRSILDAARTGIAPEQIEAAAREAVEQGLATRRALLARTPQAGDAYEPIRRAAGKDQAR